MPDAWLALIGAILGGSGLKFLEHFLSKPKIREDTAAAFRNELREEMKRLRDEAREAEASADRAQRNEEAWRERYYSLIERATSDRIERDAALQKIQDAADEALAQRHSIDEKHKIHEITIETHRALDE